MATIKQLIDEANRVIAETQQGGNTQLRIGNLYLGIIDFLDVIDKRTAEGYEYDDTALKEAIAKIDEAIALLDKSIEEAIALATQERDRLDNLINELDSDIADKVNSMMGDAAWLEEHARGIREVVNEGEIYWQSGWNANIEAYLQEVGVWARDGEVIKTQWSQIKQDVASIQSTVAEVQTDLAGRPTSTQWSQITQKVNSIEQSVNKLLYNGEFTEALQASINQSIDDNIAALSLETTYAKKDTEGAKEILEWMYSAFKNASSSELTYAQMVSAGKSGINNGVSEVRTYVNAIRDGDFLKYEAVSSIEAKVDDVITGLYNKATAEDAKTTIFSQVKKDSSDIATIVTHCTQDYSSASIATKFDNFVAGITFKSDMDRALASMVATLRDDINTSTAGLVAEATMEAAFASMTSQFNNKLAGFIAKADFEEAFVTMIAEDEDNGAVAQIFARANEAGSEIRLSADKITMTNAFADSITANTAFINFLKGGSAEFSGTITAKAGYIGGWEITEDMIRHVDQKVGLYSGSTYSGDNVDSPVRFWAGSTNRETAPFYVTHNGFLHALNAHIEGEIKATSGSIGGFEITNSKIRSLNDQIILNKDGSAIFKNLTASGATIEGLIYAKSGLCLPVSRSSLKNDNSMPSNTAVHINEYSGSAHEVETVTVSMPSNPNVGQQIVIRFAGYSYYRRIYMNGRYVYFHGHYNPGYDDAESGTHVDPFYERAPSVSAVVVYDGSQWVIASYTCENIDSGETP